MHTHDVQIFQKAEFTPPLGVVGRQRQRKVKSLPAFVQVEVAAPAAPVELVIELGAQARMRLHSESQLVLATHLIHLNGVGSC